MTMFRRLYIAVLFVIAVCSVGGCSTMSDTAPKGPDDTQTRAQVMDPLKALVAALKLDPVAGTFAFDSCDDNGDPPFRGGSGATFMPVGVTADELMTQMKNTMIAQGWSSGPGQGKLVYGTTLHKGEVFAVLQTNDDRSRFPGSVSITIYGTCDNYGDHTGSPGDTDIVDELKQS
jgi:hypothetical protein